MDDRRVIVVGSGPAGAAAALTLLEAGVPVTMLESGTPLDHGLVVRLLGRNIYRRWPSVAEGYDFTVSGDSSTRYLSALSPGGLSNLWTGATPRFAPEDFTEGERLDSRYRWPIDYDDLIPYYARMERVLDVVGEKRAIPHVPAPEFAYEHPLPRAWRQIAAHAEEFGQGMVRVPLADGPRWTIRRSGHAFNSFQAVIRHLSRFRTFELILGAHVTRLRWNPSTARVDAVDYVDRATGAEKALDASAIVVAAGPLASTKLLLQSTSSDFPEGLGNTQGVLGQYLHDHPNQWSELEVDRDLPMLDHNVYVSRAPYTESPPLMGAAVIIGALSRWDRLLSLAQRTTRRFGMVTFGTMVPSEQNWVRLNTDKRDAFGQPVLDIHIHFDESVTAAIQESHRRFTAILGAAGYAASIVNPADHLIPGWASHYGGTVRMHASPRYGMLNSWNRLHEVDNVVVADASSFTTGVEKNPTLTVMAIAARAAHRLAHDLKRDALVGPVAARTPGNALPTLR